MNTTTATNTILRMFEAICWQWQQIHFPSLIQTFLLHLSSSYSCPLYTILNRSINFQFVNNPSSHGNTIHFWASIWCDSTYSQPVMVMVSREKQQLYLHPKPMVNFIFANLFCQRKNLKWMLASNKQIWQRSQHTIRSHGELWFARFHTDPIVF
jgi:hypothetical protein